MNLNDRQWGKFILSSIFDIKKGKRLKSADQIPGENHYIGAIDSNNGVANYIEQLPLHPRNTISLSYNGSVGEAYYQAEPYWATDDVNVLYFKENNGVEFNKFIGFFICTVLRQDKYRWSYGRKWKLEAMRKSMISLPIDKNGKPDWQFMEDYIKTLHHKPIITQNKKENVPKLEVEKWGEFRVGDLFSDINKGGKYNKDDLTKTTVFEKDRIRYVTRTAEDNGCEWDVNNDNFEKLESPNAITIGDTTATCFYQEEQFICGDHMIVMRADWLNQYTGLFVVTLLQQEQYRYNYGRAFVIELVKDTKISLPIISNDDGSPFIDDTHKYSDDGYIPDWQWMENYIKSLPYGDRI